MAVVSGAEQKPPINENIPDNRLFTLSEVATFLNVSLGTIRRWTNEGKLPCYRLGGKQGSRRFFQKDILAFLTREEGGNTPQ